MKNIICPVQYLIIALLLNGCVATWVKVTKPVTQDPGNTFSVELPINWMHAGFKKDRITVTRDGLAIHQIEAMRIDHDKAFKKLEKKSSDKMLPSELAELLIAEMKANKKMENLVIIKNSPATLDDATGFRLFIEYRNDQGLRFERLIYGLVDKKGFYTLTYQAPVIHYFDRDIETFEKVVSSFKRSS